MRTKSIFVLLFMAACAAGCSSVPLPSLPSMPWSSPAVKADPSVEALFEEGTRAFSEKKYARAIDAFTKIKTDHPFSPLVTDVELKIADSFYLNQQYPEAINAFKEFQSMHPSNENIPFVVYRLGQAHFDQFTSTDREQKNTEIAKGYFETVINTYPKSPYAAPAKEKLAKCIGYLAEYDFNIASFYFQQAKYPAARDRFEEIVRKYRGTPAAAKSLFFLGESYRKEKNNVKAGLAYEALIQHYPENKYASEAQIQLAQIEKDKQDPLAMLLMRDRRPAAANADPNVETANAAKLKDINNVVAKTEVVYEEPGAEKSLFRRVVDRMNPFASADDDKKKEEKKPETGIELLAKKKAGEKEESTGVIASLWNGINPFGGGNGNSTDKKPAISAKSNQSNQFVDRIDDSLKQKGIDSKTQMAALKPPAAEDLPVTEAAAPPPAPMDSGKLLGDIDASLKKSGKNAAELPPAPEAAEAFKNPAAAQAMVAKTTAKSESEQSAASSGLLSSIDQKLKSQGIEPSKVELPPASDSVPAAPRQEQTRKVELEPKMAQEKGPLFLSPSELHTQDRPALSQESAKPEKLESSDEKPLEPVVREMPRALVKGPSQTQPAAAAQQEQKKAAPPDDEENKGVIDYLKQDLENIGKVLNPFRW